MHSLVLELHKALGVENLHFIDLGAEMLGQLGSQLRRRSLLPVFDSRQIARVRSNSSAYLDNRLALAFSDLAEW
jgi:hypothetical protein